MAIELPLDGGSRILFRPYKFAGSPVMDIRHFWDKEEALGGLVRWVIGPVIDGVFQKWERDVVTARFPSDVIWEQQNTAVPGVANPSPGQRKGQWYFNKVPTINEILEEMDLTPDLPHTEDFDMMTENKIISGYFRMKPHPTDTQAVYEGYYRPNPNDPPPKEIWDYTT